MQEGTYSKNKIKTNMKFNNLGSQTKAQHTKPRKPITQHNKNKIKHITISLYGQIIINKQLNSPNKTHSNRLT